MAGRRLMEDEANEPVYIRLTIEYDGTDFCGSQAQLGRRTVQSELERCLKPLTNEDVRVTFAGRTDSGVHAKGQVVNFRTCARHDPDTYRRALNAALPDDLAVVSAGRAPIGFHSRFDAVGREYRYRILNGAVRSPLMRRFAVHVFRPLNLEGMQKACECLLGEHDFASFTGAGKGIPAVDGDERPGTVRNVYTAKWSSTAEPDDPRRLIDFEISANAFLPHMVRNIVGTLLWVGIGKVDWQAGKKILEARDRRLAGPTAPPHGLTLMKVNYATD
jgi:tRNA pseudouridine38-40 synthase